MFKDARIPFAMPDQAPSEASAEILLDNPYFAGVVGTDCLGMGKRMAKTALDMGYTKALILAGAVGDTSQDKRVEGFTEAFTAGGGTVLGVARGTSRAEAQDKSDDLFAAYGSEADCVYTGQTDFANAAMQSMEKLQSSIQERTSSLTRTMRRVTMNTG